MNKIEEKMRLRDKLTGKIGENDIFEICYLTQGSENNKRKIELYRLIDDADERVAQKALWCFTKFSERENEWLFNKQNDLIDKALVEKNPTKLRLLLRILLRQPFEEDSLRTDFLDFCVEKITATAQPYAIRASCMKLAYEQMKFYPELLQELKMALDMLEQESLSAGLLSAKRLVMKKIERELKKNGECLL